MGCRGGVARPRHLTEEPRAAHRTTTSGYSFSVAAREGSRAPAAGTAESAERTVREAVRSRILSGELAPGTRLGEIELASQHDVSRPTARAVIASLVETRLLQRAPHSAARVTRLGPGAVRDIYRTREIIESGALAQLARERQVPPDAVAAERELEALRDAAPTDIVDPDMRFHQALVSAIGSARIQSAYDRLADEMRLCMAQVQRAALLPTELIAAEHTEILERVTDGDAEGAVTALRTHLSRARDRLVAHLP